jgi:hypothetical protein
MRPWANANSEALTQYLAAYIEGQRHVMNPANRSQMIDLLTRSFKLSPAVAEGSYAALTTPGSGLAPDARFNHEGFKTVLAIRAEMESMWGGTAPVPGKYLDLSFFDRAIQG